MEHENRPRSVYQSAVPHWASGSGRRDAGAAAAAARSIHGPGFHAPFNDHDRFLSSAGTIERHFLRHIERPPQFTTQRPQQAPPSAAGSRPLGVGRRGSSTGSSGGGKLEAARAGGASGAAATHRSSPGKPSPEAVVGAAARALGAAATRRGVPCFTAPALVKVDLADGRPLAAPGPGGGAGGEGGAAAAAAAVEPWRVARVRAYAVPIARHGYSEGGARPPHQTYAFYKYFGFAGRGAATSWGTNPTKAVRTRL